MPNTLTRGQVAEAAAGIGVYATKTVTFDGGTTNNMGDFDGTGNPYKLFTVTGTVFMKLFAVCNVDLAGASATINVGTTLSVAGLIATATGTNIDAGEIWHDNSPDASVELSSVATEKIVKADVYQTVNTANITSGSITYHCIWKPISNDGFVAAT